jgi:hypothetical protein
MSSFPGLSEAIRHFDLGAFLRRADARFNSRRRPSSPADAPVAVCSVQQHIVAEIGRMALWTRGFDSGSHGSRSTLDANG